MQQTATTPDPNRWRALALVATAVLMTVLDVSIVNVALPSIQQALHFKAEDLQWVVTAYALTFGGILLLGGRAADLLGRRRVFMVGLALFTLASLACGLATSATVLIVARAVQGLGAAIVSPAALSIVSTAFTEGRERNTALGIWGAVAGSGAAIGVLLGGVLTKYAGWEWIFIVNVPVGALVLALTPRIIRESRIDVARRRYDPWGALTVTAGLVVGVYAISKAPTLGWGATRTVAELAAAVALLVAFVIIEKVGAEPLMPLRIFRVRTLAASNIVGMLLGGVVFSMFFLLTLYVQQVLGYSALKSGMTFLVTAGMAVVAAGAAQAIVNRIGVKPVLALGMALFAIGVWWYTRLPVNGSFASDLLPGYIITGVGMAFSFVPVSIAALAGIEEREAGLASGLINTSQQIGGAVALAIASTLYITHLRDSHAVPGTPQFAVATVDGFHIAFWMIFGIAVAGFVATMLLLRHEAIAPRPPEGEVEPTSPFVPNAAAAEVADEALGID